MTVLKQLTDPAQSGAPTIVNQNFNAIEYAACYCNNYETTSGLIRGYLGGKWGGFTIAASTHTFGASTTTYVSVLRSTGALDFSTSSTNFADTTNYATVETVVTSGSAVTSATDARGGPGGVHGQSSAGAIGAVTHTGTLTANAVIVGNGTTDIKALASLGTTTTVLHGNAAGLPTYGAVSLTADVSGVLPIANFTTGTPTGSKFVRDDGVLAVPAGTGTVTSVAASVPSVLSISGSPITGAGTLAITYSGTALPVANGGTGITAFGTGIATFLGTPSSANLAAAITDETGSGVLVFGTAPTLANPVVGTQSPGDNSTKAASTAYVEAAVTAGAGTGTVTHTGGALTSNAVVLGAGTADTKVVAGITTDGTSAMNLGVAGASVGKVVLSNAASGSITIQPPTGALGTVTWTVPAATDTAVGKATTDTLTNKTLTSPTLTTPVLGTPSSGTLTNCTGLPVAGGGTGASTAAGARANLQVGQAVIAIACSDESTALTTGTNKVKFINPYSTAFNVTAVVASLSTTQTSGSIFTVDVNEAGTSILSTKLTIDNTETTSGTAATAAVISDASIAAYAEIEVDIDQVGDGTAKGLKVYVLGYPS